MVYLRTPAITRHGVNTTLRRAFLPCFSRHGHLIRVVLCLSSTSMEHVALYVQYRQSPWYHDGWLAACEAYWHIVHHTSRAEKVTRLFLHISTRSTDQLQIACT